MIWRLTWELGLFFVFLTVLLFGAAGTFDWWGGWVYLIESIVGGIAICAWLAVRDPGLLRERLTGGIQHSQVFWDKVLMSIIHIGYFAWLVLMALDRRWQISQMGRDWNYIGALLAASFYPLCWLIFRANSFAAPVVKIQAERHQQVASTGPYRIVRHPMYAGGILYFVGLPLLFGSWLGLAATPVFIALLVIRVPIEERTLRRGLPGYDAYAARVRYRLIPGIW
jgi:protein-S-isoprenylcysteine O-methyltransferase Ste14